MKNRTVHIFMCTFIKNLFVGLAFLFAFVLPTMCFAYAYPVKEIKGIEDIKKIAALKENEIDIGWLALVFAKEAFYPDLDVARYNKYLDMMATDIKIHIQTIGHDDSDTRIRVMNTYFIKNLKFEYDVDDLLGKKNSNRTINGLMDTRKGSCWTMPLLYLSVAQRLGYPIYPVSAPQHIFLRYNDTNLAMQNIEATNGGYTPDDEYIYTLEIPQKGIESGAYMKSLTYKEFLGEMIGENGRYWAQHGDMEKAREYLEIAIELEPTGAEIAVSLGSVYWHLDQDKDGLPSMDYKGKSKYYMNKAQELGAGKMIDENYLVRQRQLEKEYREKNNVK